jgi:hypothetical protein
MPGEVVDEWLDVEGVLFRVTDEGGGLIEVRAECMVTRPGGEAHFLLWEQDSHRLGRAILKAGRWRVDGLTRLPVSEGVWESAERKRREAAAAEGLGC